MQGSLFDENGFFAALAERDVKYLLIGRQACIAYGLPVMTGDYDIAVDPDDAQWVVEAAEPFGLIPSVPPEEISKRFLFSLQNDEKVDVLCARSYGMEGGGRLVFADAWARRRALELRPGGVLVPVPAIRDLIAFKRIRPRPKDLEDIRALEILAKERGE